LNPRRDNNTGDDGRWDSSDWDLQSDEGPDDFDEWIEEDEEETDPHFEVVEGLEDETIYRRSTWARRVIRFIAAIALIFFCAVFVLPSAISAIGVWVNRPDTPDYYDQIYSGPIVMRFERREVRYSIVIPEHYPIEAISSLEEPLLNAMESWSDALGDRLNFVPAPAIGGDDLLVTFVSELPSAGLATLRPGMRYRPEIFIKLQIQSPIPSAAILETIACHELGHALGIWGHSDYQGDCMYPMAVRRTPSDRDIRTLRKIYGLGGGG
jgi:hypothetical protein